MPAASVDEPGGGKVHHGLGHLQRGHMDYSERKLTGVDIYGLRTFTDADGNQWMGGTTAITISSVGGTEHGPEITINTSVRSTPDKPLASAERELVGAALNVLTRAAKENATALYDQLVKGRQNRDPKE